MNSRALLLTLVGIAILAAGTAQAGTLTVVNGTGGGTYSTGEPVAIEADAPSTLPLFAMWVGDIAGVANTTAPNTVITMPATNAAVTAIYTDYLHYSLKLREGGADNPADNAPAGPYVDVPFDDTPLVFVKDDWTMDIYFQGNDPNTWMNPVIGDPNVPGNPMAATESRDWGLRMEGHATYPTEESVLIGVKDLFTELPATSGGFNLVINKAELVFSAWHSTSRNATGSTITAYRVLTDWLLYDAGMNEFNVLADVADLSLGTEWVTWSNNDAAGGIDALLVVPDVNDPNSYVMGPNPDPNYAADPNYDVKIFDPNYADPNYANSFGDQDYDANTGSDHIWIPGSPAENAIDVTAHMQEMYATTTNNGWFIRMTDVVDSNSSLSMIGVIYSEMGDPDNPANPSYSAPDYRPHLNIDYSYDDPSQPAPVSQLTVVSGSGGGYYPVGATAAISANDPPPSGKFFVEWIGDITGIGSATDANTTITIGSSDISLTARFGGTYTLTILNAEDANGNRDVDYAEGSIRTLFPGVNDPSPYIFAWWAGDNATIANIYSAFTAITMPDADITVTATYALPVELTVIDGSGSGTYPVGREVIVTASPPITGDVFKEWLIPDPSQSGSVLDTTRATTLVVIPEDDITIDADYETGIPLTVVGGGGTGGYALGSAAGISADIPADPSSMFDAWVGDVTDVANVNASSTTVTMNAAYTVTATYTANPAAANMVAKTVMQDCQIRNNHMLNNSQDFRTVPYNKIFMHCAWGFPGWPSAWEAADPGDPGDGLVHLRPMIQFDISDITGVASATLWVHREDTNPQNGQLDVYRLMAEIDEYQTTWFLSSTGNAWTTPGGDYDPNGATGYAPSVGWHSVDVTSLLLDAMDDGQDYLGMIIQRGVSSNDFLDLTAKEASGGIYAAQLWIETTSGYDLTVVSGLGTGSYTSGEVANIDATVPVGMDFVAWVGDITDVANTASESTTITMNADYTVTATFAEFLDGDHNEDLAVDIIDLNMVLIDWGKSGGFVDANSDGNEDGTIDIVDLNLVLIDWGKTGYKP